MDDSEYDEEDDLADLDDHPTFTSHSYQAPLSTIADASPVGNTNRQSIQSDWTSQMTPRQRNRAYLGYENAPLSPSNPLNRETYTLQEENEASFSSARPSQRQVYNPQSMRSVQTSDSFTEAGGNSLSGGSTRGGGSIGGEGSINIDSPRTPVSLGGGGMSKRSTRDNSMMQFSVADGSAREFLVDGTAATGKDVTPMKLPFRSQPDHSHPTPNSAMGKASLGSFTATSMISADSAHSQSVGGLHPSLPSSYRHGQHSSTVEEEAGDISSEESNYEFEPIVIMGFKLPNWLSRIIHEPPNATRISTFVVRAAPCFWCCGDSVQATSTDRAVLNRLIVLCMLLSLVQLTGSLWLAAVLLVLDNEHGMFAEFAPNFWNLNGAALAVGSLALPIIASCFFTIRVVRVVDLVGAIRHLWLLLWLLPLQFFFTIVLFDYNNVTEVWIEKWWRADTMSFFRAQFCKEGTEESLCKVPIAGGSEFADEDGWCLHHHQSTECKMIRDSAQKDMFGFMLYYYTGMGGVGSALLALLLLMINSLERIISKPIVQKSRESNVPAWLTLPTSAGALVGSIFLFSPSSLLKNTSTGSTIWIGHVYLVTSALFLITALIGWFLSSFSIRNAADKKTKNIAVNIFIMIMATNCVLIISLFAGSIVLSGVIDDDNDVARSVRGEVACLVDQNVACTQCLFPQKEDRCPEWDVEDVARILQTQLKQSATVAAILILYAFSVLRFGFVLRRHLSMYQIDYV